MNNNKMRRNCDGLKWIFEPDGALRDIYVQEVSIEDWKLLIDFLNENYSLKYGAIEYTNKIDKNYAINFLADRTGEMELKIAAIDLDGIIIHCHFFLPDQIEFDLDPEEFKSGNDIKKILDFMSSISETLRNQVTLTYESDIEFPLIKIDVTKNIDKALTEEEIIRLRKKSITIKNRVNILKAELLRRFFPEKFIEMLLKSGSEPIRSTKKNRNAW